MEQAETSSQIPSEESAQPASFTPFFWGVLWIAVQWWFLQQPRVGLWIALGLGVVIALWAYRHRTVLVSPRSFWLGTALFLLSSLSIISFVTSNIAKVSLSVSTGLMLWFFLRQAIVKTNDELQGRTMTFVMTVSYWFGMVVIFFLGVVAFRPWWQVVLAGGFLYALVATIVWLDLQVPIARFRRALFPMLWLGAELALLGWWFSTSVWVSSLVITVIGIMMVHLCRHVWLDSWQTGRGKRYIALGTSIIVMTLLTARWI